MVSQVHYIEVVIAEWGSIMSKSNRQRMLPSIQVINGVMPRNTFVFYIQNLWIGQMSEFPRLGTTGHKLPRCGSGTSQVIDSMRLHVIIPRFAYSLRIGLSTPLSAVHIMLRSFDVTEIIPVTVSLSLSGA